MELLIGDENNSLPLYAYVVGFGKASHTFFTVGSSNGETVRLQSHLIMGALQNLNFYHGNIFLIGNYIISPTQSDYFSPPLFLTLVLLTITNQQNINRNTLVQIKNKMQKDTIRTHI